MYRRNYGNNSKNYHKTNSRKSTYEVVNAIRAMQAMPKSNGDSNILFKAKHTFDEFDISDKLKANISYKGYGTPTPIQDEAIPIILAGHDLIGIANTGTGKTAAFLIPLIEKVHRNKSERILIITPTRELADQISDELYGFSNEMHIGWTLCIGGMSIVKQIDDLAKKPNFVIGTPGRIKDLSQRRFLNLNEYKTVVLDEADRMVDMGFIHDIKYFIAGLPRPRQSLFFSATIPPKVNEILKSFVINPVSVSVKKNDSIENITHKIINVDRRSSKLEMLYELLDDKEFEKVLIFGRTKWGVQKLSNELSKHGFNAQAIHGNKNQNQRQRALNDFKGDRISILLATDIASRGIDINNISHVINYDIPGSYEDYIHRVGRTGRANKEGVAVTFIENN